MTLAPATASHTFKLGKYKATASDKQYKKLKTAKKKGQTYSIDIKCDSNKKTKTVKKWKYKKVLYYQYWHWGQETEWKHHDTYKKYIKKGWKIYGTKTYTDSNDGLYYSATYYKMKKKCTVKVCSPKCLMYVDSDGEAFVYDSNDRTLKEGHVKI